MALPPYSSVDSPALPASAQMPTKLEEELDCILNERVLGADRGWPSADSANEGIVIFGAGQLGRRILSALRRSGIDALAFSDNNPSLWAKTLDGVRVLSPAEAAETYRTTAMFVVAIWHPSKTSYISSVSTQLAELGCRSICTFPVLLWALGQEALPYYLWDLPSKLLPETDRIQAALQLMADSVSRCEFVKQVRLRALADFQSLYPPSNDVQYFPRDMLGLTRGECFVDCGAYTGDSIADFLAYTGDSFRNIIAFEPDPRNMEALRQNVARNPTLLNKVSLCGSAVGANTGFVKFNGSGLSSASSSPTGDIEVSCVTLDTALRGESPTFIKMDIEGAELEALEGAQETIRKHRPVLAICVYHTQDHLWRIPLAINELLPESSIYLRAHRADGFDLVCYAVPIERKLG